MHTRTFRTTLRSVPAAVLIALSLVGQAQAVEINVLDCKWGGDPRRVGAFVDCVNNNASKRVNAKADELKVTIEQLEAAAESLAQRVRDEVESGEAHARGWAELNALRTARRLRLADLHACLETSGGASELVGQLRIAASDPARLLPSLLERIRSRASGAVQDSTDELIAVLLAGNPQSSQVSWRHAVERTFDRIADQVPELRCAIDHARSLVNAGGGQPGPDIARQPMDVLSASAIDNGMNRAAVRDAVLGEIERRLTQAIAAALTAGVDIAADAAREGFGQAGIDIEDIVNQAYLSRVLIPQQKRGTVPLMEFARALDKRDVAGARLHADKAAAALLPDQKQRTAMLIDIGVSVVRDIGSKLVKGNHLPLAVGGGDVYDLAAEAIQTGLSAVRYAAVSAAGLIPEVGGVSVGPPAYVYDAFERIGDVVGSSPAKTLTLEAANLGWRTFVNKLRDALVLEAAGDRSAMNRLRGEPAWQRYGVLAESMTADLMLRLGTKHLGTLGESLAERERATLSLVRAARPR